MEREEEEEEEEAVIPLWLAILLWFVAGFVGLFVAALLCAAGRSEEALEVRERAGLEVKLGPLMESEEAGSRPARR